MPIFSLQALLICVSPGANRAGHLHGFSHPFGSARRISGRVGRAAAHDEPGPGFDSRRLRPRGAAHRPRSQTV
jgi:hypothetical protein